MADAGFVLEALLARMSVDRHRLRLGPGDIDAEELCAAHDVGRHADRADEYFGAGLQGAAREDATTSHLIKPFHNSEDAANHLAAFAALLGGLGVTSEMTVLDFGCGAGWTSRLLMQLGCRVIMCDVSRAALDAAAFGMARNPPIVPPGAPTPTYLHFDGHRIDLPDGSVDRVLCFDVLHHIPNQPEVLAELSRVMTDDGVVGFFEPGPDHSRQPSSQFEMRHHGFLERDVLIEPILHAALAVGFDRISFGVAPVPLRELDLKRYTRLLRRASIPLSFRRRFWNAAANTRLFYLTKPGAARPDPRRQHELAGTVEMLHVDENAPDDMLVLDVRVTNAGTSRWRRSDVGLGGVFLGAHELGPTGETVRLEAGRFDLPRDEVAPGESVDVHVELPRPSAGVEYELDLCCDGFAWFSKLGSPVCRATATRLP